MSCLDMKLNATLTNASALPFAEVDSVLAPGSLMLFEPAHPANAQTGTALNPIAYNQGYGNSVVQFPNIAARPGAVALAAQTATTWQITGSSGSNGVMTITSWGTCPGVHVGDELWNSAGTIMLGTFATGNQATGNPTVTPAQTLASGTYTVKRGTKPVILRTDSMNSSGVEVNFGYEWTPKGGLHLASSRTTMTTGLQCMGVSLPGALKEYLYANPTNKLFMSVWYNLTAPVLSGYTGTTLGLGKNAGSNYWFAEFGSSIGTMANYAMPVGTRNTVGMHVEQMANPFYGSTALSNSYGDFLSTLHFGVGAVNGSWGTTYAQNNSASAIIYRVYLEDLTVSGRTYAQVQAKDNAAYAVAFGAGGRYYGDTYTAPATLMP
ncbi:MAG TPA: hypothetical protein VN222_10620 [Novosphingobium sp.]|nr:hypothetical protein [Novosphingobium sp.]